MRKSILHEALGFGALVASTLALGCNEILGLDGPPPGMGAGAGGSNGDGTATADEPGNAGAPERDICAPTSHLDEFIPGPSADDGDEKRNCTCTNEAPSCHAIYQLKVTAVAPDRWHADLTFRKKGHDPILKGTTYWIVQLPGMPSCSELSKLNDAMVHERVPATAWEIQVPGVPLWPNQAAFDAAPVGDTRRLFVITDDRSKQEFYGRKIWFQEKPIEFRKYCD